MNDAGRHVQRLLRMKPDPTLLDRWAASIPGDASPAAKFQETILVHARTAPDPCLRAVQRVRKHAALDADARARTLRLHAQVLHMVWRVKEACRLYRAAWEGFEALGAKREAGLTAIGWTGALNQAGETRLALDTAALAATRIPTRDLPAHARLATNVGNILYWSGRYGDATVRFREARNRFRRSGDRFASAMASYNLGNALLRTGRARDAEQAYREAADIFETLERRVPELYARHSLAATELARGNWDQGLSALADLEPEFADLGDARAVAAMHRETAELLCALGATEAASDPAARAYTGYADLGLANEAGRTAMVQARIFAERGAFHDADVRLEEARTLWTRLGATRNRRMTEVEAARVLTHRGATSRAAALARGAQSYLDRVDPAGSGAQCRGVLAAALLEAGSGGRAATLARRAHRQARAYPANLERPVMAMTVARAEAARGNGAQALRWSSRAVNELEGVLLRFGTRGTRSLTAGSRDRLYRDAVDLTLGLGGPRAPERAVDLIARARSPRLVEDLLHSHGARDDSVRLALQRLRDELLAAPDSGDPDVRFRSLRAEAQRLEGQLEATPRRSRPVVQRALEARRLSSWRGRLGDRSLVLYESTPAGWRGFVVRSTGAVRVVPLPDAAHALRTAWFPLRLLLETAARSSPTRRREFLTRTLPEANAAMNELRRGLWDPLDVAPGPVVVVPSGALHSVPLEALAHTAGGETDPHPMARLPHPALLAAPTRTRPPSRALVLSGAAPGLRREATRVAHQLRRAGFSVRRGGRRRDLADQQDPIDVLHVAAHGVFHRRGWLLSGLELSDGWLGFESLDRSLTRGSLLYFGSCESGLTHELPGSDLEGWMAAGLGAGAREMVLTLWKVDDEGATRFADAFYDAWAGGASAAVSAGLARGALMREGAHPFTWAPFLAAG